MTPRGETLDSRVARLEEAIAGFREDRIEARQDRKDIIGRLDNLSQAVSSTGAALQALSLEKCGERLSEHDKLIADTRRDVDEIKARTKNLPVIETEVMFWRRVLGGGFHAIWKIGAFALSTGSAGAWIGHLLWH